MNTFTFELSTIENLYFSGMINEVDEIFNSMVTKIENGNVVFLVRKLDDNHTETVEIFCENAALISYQNKFMHQHHVSLDKLFEMRNMNLRQLQTSRRAF
jgi:hypothetical protein